MQYDVTDPHLRLVLLGPEHDANFKCSCGNAFHENVQQPERSSSLDTRRVRRQFKCRQEIDYENRVG